MEKQTLVFLFVCGFLMLSVTCQESMLSPPGRPSEFRTPDQLRKYLKALNDYYAIVGRPSYTNLRCLPKAIEVASDEIIYNLCFDIQPVRSSQNMNLYRFGRSAIKQPGAQTFGNLDSNE